MVILGMCILQAQLLAWFLHTGNDACYSLQLHLSRDHCKTEFFSLRKWLLWLHVLITQINEEEDYLLPTIARKITTQILVGANT